VGGKPAAEKDPVTPTAVAPKKGPEARPARGAEPDDPLKDVRARMEIEEQRLTQVVEENLRKARDRYPDDPEAALGMLRDTLSQVRDDPDVGTRARDDLLTRIAAARRELTREEGKQVWKLDFQYKNLRLVTVDVPGQGRKPIWYCWYKVVNPTDESLSFVPDFELVAGGRVYHDTILPRVFEAVRRIEDPAQTLDLKNSVTVAMEPIPPSKLAAGKGVAGLAFWDADVPGAVRDFTLFVSGLTNAWSSDGDSIRRRVLKIGLKRVGNEMFPDGPAEWTYRSYARKVEEDGGDPRVEMERLIDQLTQRIADLEAGRNIWKGERQVLQDRLRELRNQAESLAENPPADWKKEDRAAANRQMLKRIQELERQIASGDRREMDSHTTLEAHKQRLEELRRLLPGGRDKSPREPRTEEDRRRSEIEKLKRTIADLEQQQKGWQKERGQLRDVIAEWKTFIGQADPDKRKVRETVLRELDRQLVSGEAEGRNRQVELELLNRRLEALQEASGEPRKR
jgi:hypothetical protein